MEHLEPGCQSSVHYYGFEAAGAGKCDWVQTAAVGMRSIHPASHVYRGSCLACWLQLPTDHHVDFAVMSTARGTVRPV